MMNRLPGAFALVLLSVACSKAGSPPTPTRSFSPRATGAVEVTLPERADAEIRVRDRESGMHVAVRMSGARPVPARFAGTAATYRKAAPNAGDVRVVPTPEGAEDFVTFGAQPKREELVYGVDVSDAAGLRLVGNVLELLDASGTPRLRMTAPYVLDRRGQRIEARVTLDDCNADTSGRAPWGRPVTPPGRARCDVRVAWGGEEPRVEYPAVLDPSWTATKNNMVDARRAHTATVLTDGTVLVVGGASGTDQSPTYLKSAELFDPKTNTFAATGSMTDARSEHAAVLLMNGHVVVAGGKSSAGPLSSAEVYVAGKFHTVDALQATRTRALGTLLGTGAALVAGGLDATNTVVAMVETFDAASEKWTPVSPMTHKRMGFYLTTLSNGSALAVAGISTTTLADLADAEIYTPVTNKWTSAGSLAETRYDFGGATLADGRVLVAGGYEIVKSGPTSGAELYDPKKLMWSKAASLATARSELTLTALPGGLAVASGGVVRDGQKAITAYLKSVEVYDPGADTWSALPDMKQPRYEHTATALGDGRVLVAGGAAAQGAVATAELLALDAGGATCKASATCASGFCVDGVCCDGACDATCNGCTRTVTGKVDGTCALALAGQDPHDDCKDDGAPACKMDGLCDGKGACESYPSSRCTPNPCKVDGDCSSGFCADGICCDQKCDGDCEACTKAKKGSGADGTCGPVAKGTDPDGDCGTLGTGVCRGAATCDGASACEASTKGKACAAAKCADAVTLAAAAECGSAGDCTPDTTDCTPFVCDPKMVACTTSCAADTDCAPGATCMNGLCAKSENGTACTKAVECSSGFCADGFCCDAKCDGQCEACDGSGSEGKCQPVKGPPKNGRAACDGDGVCAGACNGAMTDLCDYPHADTTCDGDTANSCTGGTEMVNRCNGLGACVASPRDCTPFGCGKDACKTSCKSDADCVAGVHCDADGVCTPGIALSCKGDHTMTTVDGGTHDCGAYLCVRGSCNTSCKADDDCTDGAKCESGKCHGGESGGGCGCQLGQGGGGSNAVALAALSLLFARMRRRHPSSKGRGAPAARSHST